MRISKAEAARRADVGRMTWWEWEKGRRHPYDSNYAGIEDAMEWKTGSVQAIEDGGSPTELTREDRAEPDLRDDVERRIWAFTAVDQAERWAYIRIHRELEQEREREARKRSAG